MNRRLHICAWLLIAIVLLAPDILPAAPVSAQKAVDVVSRWTGGKRRVVRGERHRMHPRSAPTGRARTCAIDGTNLFHLVSLEGGGFVTVAADDSRPAIMGFSASGELPDADPNNPFWSLVGADAEAAAEAASTDHGKPQGRRRGRASHNGRGRRFTFSDSTTTRSGRSALQPSKSSGIYVANETKLDDVRVTPLVESKWNQKSGIYNYYTPKNYHCGCVATAMAQLMRYHCYPTNSVTVKSFQCRVDNVSTNMMMMGGTYDWTSMPLVPSSYITDEQRASIGKICYDAGVSMRMEYTSSGSGALLPFAFDPLKNVFKYDSANCYLVDPEEDSLSDSSVKNGILANLDAGLPVLLGICWLDGNTAKNGHAILADGYGYLDGTLYCHLNMGWSGSSDYWYALPNIGTSYNFNSVLNMVYNVHPGTNTGEIVSGRIADRAGNPVSNATVTAAISYVSRLKTITSTQTVRTGANGIYAFTMPKSTSCTVNLCASGKSWASTNITITTTANTTMYYFNFNTGEYRPSHFSIGNSWGNDFTYVPQNFKMTIR